MSLEKEKEWDSYKMEIIIKKNNLKKFIKKEMK
jgi:hypothetical protein